MNKYYLILNPTAKSGKGKKKWEEIENLLKQNHIDYEIAVSQFSGHSIQLAHEACLKQAYKAIVAVGGDGTINEVLNGICSARDKVQKLTPMGILYTGTSPDICKYHQIPLEMHQAVQTLIHGTPTIIDVGEIEHIWKDEMTTRFFLCSVNLGIGARVADGSNSGLRRYLGDFLGTLVSIVKSVWEFYPQDFNCTIDGKEMIFKKTINMTIGKNPYVASGFKVGVDIGHSDGKSYLFSINNFNFVELMRNLPKVYDGSFYKHKKNTLLYFEKFYCQECDGAPEVEYDGDPQGFLPATITLMKNRFELIK